MLRVVCAVIQRPDGHVLAALRPPGKSLAEKWEFPGGTSEPDESPSDALIREIKEEMGVTIRLIASMTPVRHAYPDFAIELVPFLCEITSGEVMAHEHSELRWVSRTEAASLDWAAADIPILQEIPWQSH
jgi:8-oxo-dGTP diphosphatase